MIDRKPQPNSLRFKTLPTIDFHVAIWATPNLSYVMPLSTVSKFKIYTESQLEPGVQSVVFKYNRVVTVNDHMMCTEQD